MSGDPFLLRSGDRPVPLRPVPFPGEVHLQQLIAENPALLPRGDGSRDRRWLLVTRELPISADGTNFSLDHLFLDEEGVPTLVECKLASNPQHRREVIGQALDYASWFAFEGSDVIRRYIVARCGDEADREVRDAFAEDDELEFDVEAFWLRVDDQLRQRRMRLFFVGDTVSPLVRRVAEFLNRELRNVEVLAVEYAVWEDDVGTRILVPTVHGMTSDSKHAGSTSSSTPARVWTNDEWLAAFESKNGAQITAGARRLIERWKMNESAGFRTVAGPGVGNEVAFHMYLQDGAGKWAPAMRITSTALVLPTDQLEKRTSWIGVDAATQFVDHIGSAAGIDVDSGNLSGRLRLPLTVLASADRVEELGSVLQHWAEHLKQVW